MTPAALLLAVVMSAAPAANATRDDAAPPTDWPQWRGPARDGKSLDTGLSQPWPESGPKLLWAAKGLDTVGTGYGSVAVVGNQIFLVGGEEEAKEAPESCICLDASTGKQLWKTPLNTAPGSFQLQGWGRGPRSTPTVDGDHVYVLGVMGDLVCLSKADGKTVWHKNLVKEFGGAIPAWGYSESVLVDGENVICTPGKGTGMVALNKKNGETVWTCKDFGDSAGYSSIVPTVVGNVRQYVQQTMSSALGVRATDGKLLWKVGEIGRRTAVIPTPIVADGYAFFTAGYGAGCECYKLSPEGNGTKAELVYTKYKTLANHHGGVIAVGDHVYGHSDAGGWTCFAFKEAKDEAVWQSTKLPGKGSITYADGHFYCYSENTGTLARIKASTTDWEETGRFTIPETSKVRPRSGKVWPHPVIANGKLFLRDYELLYCYELRP